MQGLTPPTENLAPHLSPLTGNHNNSSSGENDNDMAFTCNICLDGVKDKDPVVTQCGHLYCWPCLYRWLHSRRNTDSTCPVCKAGVTQENVIPIFIRGSMADPRQNAVDGGVGGVGGDNSVPNRPHGHRPLPPLLDPTNNGGPGANLGNNPYLQYNTQLQGLSVSTSFGYFPSLFGLQFQSFAPPIAANTTTPDNVNTAEEEKERLYLSRVLLFLGVCVICCLLFF
jgi:E3 ubiquitin-protein ligase RNF5